MKPGTREQATERIRRIAGQGAGIERMIEEDLYCVDVLLQVAAVRAAHDGLGEQLLRGPLEACVADAFASGRPRGRKEELGGQTLFFAFVYDAIGVPMAAGVLYPWLGVPLSPMPAAGATSPSSLWVIADSLRLRTLGVRA